MADRRSRVGGRSYKQPAPYRSAKRNIAANKRAIAPTTAGSGLRQTATKTSSIPRRVPSINAPGPLRLQSIIRRGPIFASLDSGEPHLVTKSAYPRFLQAHSEVVVGGTAVIPNRKRALRVAEDNLRTGPVHPGTALRRRTPPGGHFYEKDGRLFPVGVIIVDGPSNRGGERRQNDNRLEFQPRRPTRKQLASKSARRITLDDSPSESSESDESRLFDVEPEDSDAEAEESRREIIVISSDSEYSESSEDEQGAQLRLFQVIAPLIRTHYWHFHSQTPFLVRNLRKGFYLHCLNLGIPTDPPTTPEVPYQATYRFRLTVDEEWEDYVYASPDWICPLCDLHGKFRTREMLAYHVKHDHSEAHHAWASSPRNSGNATQWSIVIQWTTSALPPTCPMRRSWRQKDEDRNEIELLLAAQSARDAAEETGDLNAQLGDISLSVDVAVTEDMPRLKCEYPEEISIPEPPTFQPDSPVVRSLPAINTPPPDRPLPRTGITSDGKLIPPPKHAKYGAAAEPPLHSCRPGGPRLYDHLNELPMEPFGVLAWSITHREEEIFEHEDISDEDKVVMALWNRWIMLNREAFVFGDRYEQILIFLKEYYVMIHRAAGWNALRWFLLTLLANRFLTISEVSKTMVHYEKLVGMQNWYVDDEEPE